MTQLDDTPIRRRPDGSVDTDFYLDRATHLRSVARAGALRRLLRRLYALAISSRFQATNRPTSGW
jgi:hypothetical protein